MPWNPEQYARFREERAAPFYDLLALIDVRPELRVIDLGCGSGELTAVLAEELPESDVTGLDSSPEMLAGAKGRQKPGLRFVEGSIQNLTGEYDLVFSNAALQWLPDHRALIPELWGHVREGGQLAAQVPSNFDHPSHTLLARTAAQGPFANVLGGWTRNGTAPVGRQSPVLGIVEYGELLFSLGGANITAFEKIYPVVLKDADGVLEWVSGTALVPYLERLPQELREAFREAYRNKLWARWPRGPVFYAFKRTLFAARKLAGRL